MAHEESFLTLLVAAERVGVWLDEIKAYPGTARCKNAVLQLAQAVEEREAYAEEARRAGAVRLLTRLMANTDTSTAHGAHLASTCAKALTALDTHSGRQRRCFEYAPGISIDIQEGALGDGLGARVWLVAHLLARQLAHAPLIVAGKSVLELGAGCGVAGIVAAKVGAASVTLTDVEAPVLANLCACVAINHTDTTLDKTASGGLAAAAGSTAGGPTAGGPTVTDQCVLDDDVSALLFDPDDASSCGDEDALFGALLGGEQGGEQGETNTGAEEDAWDVGTMHIRYLNWNECLSPSRATKAATAASRQRHALGAAQEASDGGDASQHTLQASQHTLQASQHTTQESQHTTQASQHTTQASQPPAVHPDMRFDVVLATDVLYEADMAYGVAAAVRQYLQHTGRALIVNAVRYPELHDLLLQCLTEEGLVYHAQQIDTYAATHAELFGVLGANTDYEGGFVALYVEHGGADAGGKGGWGGVYDFF